jgi:hypothetical protein
MLALLGFLDSRLGLLADTRSELRRVAEPMHQDSRFEELLKQLEATLESIP